MAGSSHILASIVATCILSAASGAQTNVARGNLQSANDADESSNTITQPLVQDPQQSLMICNGYARNTTMVVTNMRTQYQLTKGRPLAYKECGTFRPTLRDGDRLDFTTGNISVGIFRALGMPKVVDALMLIPHRRAPNSMSAAFESHAFVPGSGPQIAVVDAYRGKDVGKVKIMDVVEDGKRAGPGRVEELRFSSVVALAPGNYMVMLEGENGKEVASSPLHVQQGPMNYVVMRTGIGEGEKAQKAAYPQELVVFEHKSGAPAAGLGLLAAAAVFMGLARWA